MDISRVFGFSFATIIRGLVHTFAYIFLTIELECGEKDIKTVKLKSCKSVKGILSQPSRLFKGARGVWEMDACLPGLTLEYIYQFKILQDLPKGAPTPKVGEPTYYLAKYSWKLHENEENWAEKRGRQNFAMGIRRCLFSIHQLTLKIHTHTKSGLWIHLHLQQDIEQYHRNGLLVPLLFLHSC